MQSNNRRSCPLDAAAPSGAVSCQGKKKTPSGKRIISLLNLREKDPSINLS